MTAHYVWTTSALELGRPSACPRLCTCPESRRLSVSDQYRHAARIANQDVLVRKGLRAMPSRLWRSESKLLGIHWELLMQVPKVADDSQHLVGCCHSCSRECGRLLPDRWHIADKDCSHASPTA